MRTQPSRIRITPRRQNNVADKLRNPRPIHARNNNSLRHARMPQQRCLDLPRLNAEAANLDLLVRAPHKLQNPIPAPARQVPAAVHPAPRSTIPIRNKALRRQPATPDIPTPNPSPRDVKLPNNPNRHRLQTTIQDINPRVPDRTTKQRDTGAGQRFAHGRAVRRPGDQRPTTSAGQASPATINVCSGTSSGKSASSTGGKVAWLTSCSRIRRASASPSRCAGASTSVAPDAKAVAISDTAASKLGEAN